jgi:DNA (cytosine-5)-methyltransferase 1
MSMDFYDFFSGCGGTSAGMQAAGLTVRLGIDWDADAHATFAANFAKAKFLCQDLRTITTAHLCDFIPKQRSRPIVFGACAPCQPFSRQNRLRADDDNRRTLLREFHRFVRAFKPEYLFVENVPELGAEERDGPFGDFTALLERLGYWFAYKTVMAYHYGVPQRRRRLILVASKLAPISFPEATHGPGTDNPKLPAVWDHIGHLPPIAAGEAHPDVPNHRAAILSPMNLKRITSIPVGGSRLDLPKTLQLDCHKFHDGHTDVYGRIAKDQPAPALTTRCISLSNGRFGHPTQHRAISVREAACIQTFPMSFVFEGSMTSAGRQVGNAVPVELARIFGHAFLTHHRAVRRKNKAA